MNFARIVLALAAALVVAGCATSETAPPPEMRPPGQMLLDSGDQLQIVVLGQADLGGTFPIDEAGAISMPLIGLVTARGQTTDSLEGVIAARLRQGYLRAPDVTIQVAAYRPIFVMGEVNNAGRFDYVTGLTVQQAVAIAGGFTARANQIAVDVIRVVGGQSTPIRLGMLDPIMPGDTITVRLRLL